MCDTIFAGVVVYRLSYIYVHMCRYISRREYIYVCTYSCIHMCMIVSWLYVYIYMYMCIYVHAYIGARTYLHGYVECVCGHMYFCRNHWYNLSISKDDLIQMVLRLKRASILLSYLLGSPGNIQSGNIFTSSLWVAKNSAVGNVHPYMYTSKVSLLDRREIDSDRHSAGKRESAKRICQFWDQKPSSQSKF